MLAPAPTAPANPPPPWPWYINEAMEAFPVRHQQIRNATLIFHPDAPAPHFACTYTPRSTTVPPQRVGPRKLTRIVVAAPRVAILPPGPSVSKALSPVGLVVRTRSRNPNLRTVAQQGMISYAAINQINNSPASLGRRYPLEIINAVVKEETEEIIEHQQITKSPNYRNLYKNSYRDP